jgi:glycosyltransferase involved in cell wall biosynthesis
MMLPARALPAREDVEVAETDTSGLTILMPFMGSNVGGSHISGLLLGRGLQQHFGCRIVVVAPRSAGVLRLARDHGLAAMEMDEAPTSRIYDPVHVLKGLPRRIRLLRDLPTEAIVHTNDLNALQAWGPAARFLGLPVVHHDRGLGRMLPKSVALQLASHVVSISDATFARLKAVRAARKSQVIDPFELAVPADGAATRRAVLAELGAPENAPLVGFVGNFWERKRPLFFLDAARCLLDAEPRAHFVLYGRDGDHSVAQMQDEIDGRGLSGRVLLAGFRMPPERNIASLDVLAAPAVREPLGRTPVEALLLGIPYVATDEAGQAEILRRWGGGVGVPSNASPDEFAAAILRVIRAPGDLVLDPAARARLADELSLEAHARRIMALYGEVRRGGGRPPS